ncbi:MAG: ABC transporter permease subunit [Spirochaetaceae bacterium]
MAKKNRLKQIRRDRALYLLLLPLVLYYIVFHYIPMYGITMAFKDYNIFAGLMASPWVGLENFKLMFLNDEFLIVLRNTLFLNILGFIIAFPAPIIVALLLNELRSVVFKRTVQGIIFLPHFLSWVIVAGLINILFSPSTGLINSIITMFGGDPIYFMSNKAWWVIIYQFSGVWKDVGWGTIIFLAALSAINPDLYAAAKIDGASRWQRIVHITLPGITSTIIVVMLLSLGSLIAIGFDRPFLLGNPMVMDVSDVISTYVYRVGLLNIDYSYAAAVGLFQSIVNLLFLLFSNWMSVRVKGEGIL